nr:hypothetical protein [Paenibacillus peoriae]
MVFDRAKRDLIYSEDGKAYIDFLGRCRGAEFGHNNDYIKDRVLDYLTSDRIMHGLDMYTMANREFIQSLSERILEPKKLNDKLQICGPTETNAMEAAPFVTSNRQEKLTTAQPNFHLSTPGLREIHKSYIECINTP